MNLGTRGMKWAWRLSLVCFGLGLFWPGPWSPSISNIGPKAGLAAHLPLHGDLRTTYGSHPDLSDPGLDWSTRGVVLGGSNGGHLTLKRPALHHTSFSLAFWLKQHPEFARGSVLPLVGSLERNGQPGSFAVSLEATRQQLLVQVPGTAQIRLPLYPELPKKISGGYLLLVTLDSSVQTASFWLGRKLLAQVPYDPANTGFESLTIGQNQLPGHTSPFEAAGLSFWDRALSPAEAKEAQTSLELELKLNQWGLLMLRWSCFIGLAVLLAMRYRIAEPSSMTRYST